MELCRSTVHLWVRTSIPETSVKWKKARSTSRFLIMRLLVCPIYGNQHHPWSLKGMRRGQTGEAKAEERSIRQCETRSAGYLLFIDPMMQEKHLRLLLNWGNKSSCWQGFTSSHGCKGQDKNLHANKKQNKISTAVGGNINYYKLGIEHKVDELNICTEICIPSCNV